MNKDISRHCLREIVDLKGKIRMPLSVGSEGQLVLLISSVRSLAKSI